MHLIVAPQPIANDAATGSLEDALRQALAWAPPETVRIATAYLSPSGLLSIEPSLTAATSVKLLLGERPFMTRRGPSDVLAQPGEDAELQGPSEVVDWHGFLDGEYPWLLLTREQREDLANTNPEAANRAGVNLDMWRQVHQTVEFLRREQVEVRRYLGKHTRQIEEGKVLAFRSPSVRLHAKAYLFSGSDSSLSAVGSSNLTHGGLHENVELNLLSHDPALAEQLAHWFDDRWAQGQDCRQEFINLLEDCVLFGRRYQPWHVFIKSLHAAYGRFLNLGLAEDVAALLADFQAEAVRRCLSMLDRHWGAMLCDSVGLGKTWEGLGILSEFARRRDGQARALIICPAQLESNWDHERTREFDIRAEVVTMESLPRLVDLDDATPLERAAAERRLYHLQQANVILVDESHNFRNPETKRYRALMEIIRGGTPDKRVLLMTATPINNSVWDLYHQLQLITRGDDTWYAGRGPVANLRATFNAVEEGEGGVGLLDTMLLSLVRRTRHDVRALQAAGDSLTVGDEPLRFPEHEIPKAVAYSLQNLYGTIYHEVLQAIENLTFAVYRLEEYGVDTGERDSEERVRQRSANFVGIMRTILLKRMESSVAALTATVDTLVHYLDQFLARLDDGKVLTPKQAHRLRAVLGGSLPTQTPTPKNGTRERQRHYASCARRLRPPTSVLVWKPTSPRTGPGWPPCRSACAGWPRSGAPRAIPRLLRFGRCWTACRQPTRTVCRPRWCCSATTGTRHFTFSARWAAIPKRSAPAAGCACAAVWPTNAGCRCFTAVTSENAERPYWTGSRRSRRTATTRHWTIQRYRSALRRFVRSRSSCSSLPTCCRKVRICKTRNT